MNDQPETLPSDPTPAPALTGKRWASLVAFVTMLLTLVPYLIGASFADSRRYMWLGYNLDDSCVYLSWMRQAADGGTRALNLFTTEAQHGMMLNPLFLILGKVAGITGLPLIGVYHGARLLFGFLLLLVVWEAIREWIRPLPAQRLAFLAVCFGSGLGWLPFWWQASPIETPIDKWQPEAVTFLSLYLSPLFCFSLALQVGILLLLYRGLKSGKTGFAAGAGGAGFILGLVHSYDVISVSAVWVSFLLVCALGPGKSRFRAAVALLQAAVAGLLTLPAVGYVFLQFKNEPVFRARANVATLSPSLVWVLMGYGLLLLLAGMAVRAIARGPHRVIEEAEESGNTQKRESSSSAWTMGAEATALLFVWAVANLAISYLPRVAFQRKMLQGAHFPIAMLAGIGMAVMLERLPFARRPLYRTLTAGALLFLLSLTNLAFVLRDITNDELNLAQTKLQRPYLQTGEIEALEWIQKNTPAEAAIQSLPWLLRSEDGQYGPYDASVACFTPGLIHRAVYCGHWGETPDFGGKLKELTHFGRPATTDEQRVALLRKMKVRYLLFTQKAANDSSADALLPMFRGRLPLPDYLKLVHSNDDADVYEVVNLEAH